jgi:hypothetical protein
MSAKLWTVAVAAAWLTSCAAVPPPMPPAPKPSLPVVTPTPLTAAQIAAVHKGLRASLKDPDSARFGRIIGGKTPTGTFAVCGYVNARNSFGGYTGEKPFTGMLLPEGFVTVAIGGDDSSTMATYHVCSDQGLGL